MITLMRPSSRSLRALFTLVLASAALAACGDDDTTPNGGGGGDTGGGGADGGSPPEGGAGAAGGNGAGGDGAGGDGAGGGEGGEGGGPSADPSVFATTNPAGRDGDTVVRFEAEPDAPLATLGNLDSISGIQSVTFDGDGAGYLTYDRTDATGGLMVVQGLAGRTADGILGAGTRRIEGPATELMAPKGVELMEEAELILVADTGAMDIKAYAFDAEGDEAPSFVVDLGGATAWDMDYDDANDRLYVAATNGTVLVYDDFSVGEGAAGPTRTITPTDGTAKISVNLHGIQFVPSPSVLVPAQVVLTDVGDAMSATDGQLFTIANPATATGETAVRLRIAGATSLLGNPVDLAVESGIFGTDVYVAEKSNDRLLRFDDITTTTGTVDVAAAEVLTLTKPESVVLASAGIAGTRIYASTNPAGRDMDSVTRIVPAAPGGDLAVEATQRQIGTILSIQSATFDDAGAAFVSYDRPGGVGGLMVIDGAAQASADGTIGDGDRRIEGALTGLVAPKGLIVSSDLDVVLVADTGAFDIKAFALDASGDVAPTFTVSNLGAQGRAVWDIDYDAASDRLYAAGTDGVVLVYDDFSENSGAEGPTRQITPSENGAKVSVNLHGIEYVAAQDLLLLSDVGSAQVTTDGQLFSIATASTVDGIVNVRWRAAGANTVLGNPVDIAFDGEDLLIAEKSNDALLRYEGVADRTGVEDVAADASVTLTKPESVFYYQP